jgi:hypothetical protein
MDSHVTQTRLGAALENFPAQKREKKFWFHVHNKNRSQKNVTKHIRATPEIGDFHFRILSINQPLQYYYCRITRACSRFWRCSRRGTSLARANAKPESRICNSPWRKNHRRTLKFTATMAILPLSSAEVPPRNA